MSEATRRTVQEYIDETPLWSDGTPVAASPLSEMQWRIWMLSTAGKFFEGMVVFMAGVALPLIAYEFHLKAIHKGMLGAVSLFGILIGASTLGSLSDRFGRRQMFILEMIIFTFFLTGVALSPNFWFLMVCLFGMGVALGCDYPTAHLVISESIPSSSRGKLVLGAFGFQAAGALMGTLVGFIILRVNGSISDWRLMFGCVIFPAVVVTIGRCYVTQSAHWLVSQGRIAEAEKETEKLLLRKPAYPTKVVLRNPHDKDPSPNEKASFFKLFSSKKRRRATILASVPWFLQDLGTYGIGVFIPIILAKAVGVTNEDARNVAEVIHNSMTSAKGAALIDMLLIVGIAAAVVLVDRVGRIRLQVFGFIGCGVGLFIAALSTCYPEGNMKMLFIYVGFMTFNFMTNIGPNAMTYLLAGEVFPTKIRGMGAGFAASVGKIGAVVTTFLFPILLRDISTALLLYVLVGTSLLGAAITQLFGIETKGLNLEKLDHD